MSELDALIETGLRQLADRRAPSEGPGDVVGAVRRRVARRHRRRVSALVAAPLVVVAAGAWALWPSGSDHTAVVTDPGPTTTEQSESTEDGTSEAVPGVTELDPGPLSPRLGAALVDLGDGRILVWGGGTDVNFGFAENGASADGAVYDARTAVWMEIAVAPFPSQPSELAQATFTGEDVIVLSGRRTAAWDPGTDTWRELDDAPGEMFRMASADGMIVAWERYSPATPDPVWAALDPGSGAWTELDRPPVSLERTTAVWSDSELIVVGHPAGVRWYVPAEGAAFDPVTSSWRRLPTAPIDSQAMGSTWLGDEMLVVNYDMGAARYDPRSNRWRSLPQIPRDFTEAGVDAVSTDETALVLTGTGPALLTADERWVPGPPTDVPALASMVAVDGDVFILGRSTNRDDGGLGPNEFVRLRLAALQDPRSFSIGEVIVELPSGSSFVSSEGTGLSGPSSTTTIEVVFGPDACAIVAQHGVVDVIGGAGPVMVVPANGSPPWEAQRLDGTSGTRIGRGSLSIECGSLERSVELASYIRLPDHWYDE